MRDFDENNITALGLGLYYSGFRGLKFVGFQGQFVNVPLSYHEIMGDVIGVEAPLARVATTFRVVEASDVGCARRPAWASSELKRQTVVSRKTKPFHQRPERFTGDFALGIGRIVDRQSDL